MTAAEPAEEETLERQGSGWFGGQVRLNYRV